MSIRNAAQLPCKAFSWVELLIPGKSIHGGLSMSDFFRLDTVSDIFQNYDNRSDLTFFYCNFAHDARFSSAGLFGLGQDRRLCDDDTLTDPRPKFVRPGQDLVHKGLDLLL